MTLPHLTASAGAAAIVAVLAQSAPAPPPQPVSGPGGRTYMHASVTTTRVGEGAEAAHVFEPAEPRLASAPVVVFCHGWAGTNPDAYGAWITHVVRRGVTVVYPQYQADVRTPVANFTQNALTGVRRALEVLRQPGHAVPDDRGLVFAGHSMGGLVAANLAVRAARGELPPPLALLAVEPGKTWPERTRIAFDLDDLSQLPPHLLLVTMAGQDDELVRDIDARRIYRAATRVSPDNKDYVVMLTDLRGQPALIADHTAPTSPAPLVGDGMLPGDRRTRTTDALDFYASWKILDGLADAVFRGVHREYALGNTPEQRFMGHWSDGVPVRELMVGWP